MAIAIDARARGTVISNNTCVVPVVQLQNVVAALPAAAQSQLAPIALVSGKTGCR